MGDNTLTEEVAEYPKLELLYGQSISHSYRLGLSLSGSVSPAAELGITVLGPQRGVEQH